MDACTAAVELKRRRGARGDLIGFTEYTFSRYEAAAHHRLISDALMRVASGEIDRLMIFMPPRHGKSELASIRFPAFYLGTHPENYIIAASYGSDLASDFGRKVRNLIVSDEYQKLFSTELSQDSKAANRWHTSKDGAYFAVGVGSSITGRGGDIILIDDPLKDREAADSEIVRQRVWDWYTSTAYTRLEKAGAIILIQCMVGDTPVLMADGNEKPLRDIKVGDVIATYDKGRISTAKVLNWKNQGLDYVYTIKTISGITVKANERHPFLVFRDGETEWVIIRDLRPGDQIIMAESRRALTEGCSVNTSSVTSPPSARDTACPITTKPCGPVGIDHHQLTRYLEEMLISGTGTELTLQSTKDSLPIKTENAQSACYCQPQMYAPIGVENFASTTATKPEGSEDSCAMTATSPLGMEKQKKSCSAPLDTYETTPETIIEITKSGYEDVFDIEVAGTENFIANGLVSHNTRWHEDDLAGRLLEQMDHGGDQWEVLDLPALTADDTVALWPDKYSVDALKRIRSAIGVRDWSALYQQRPAPEEGVYFKREWFGWYDELPEAVYKYGASDYAVTEGGGDFTVHGIMAVDEHDNLYIEDIWRKQSSSDEWIEALLDLADQHKPMNWGEEGGQIIKSVGPFINKRMQERNVWFTRTQFASAADKPTRARSIQARAAAGKVFLPRNKPWVADFLHEILTFPAGKNDDQVDVLSLFGRMLDEMIGKHVFRKKTTTTDRWDKAFKALEHQDTTWRLM